MPDNSSRPSKSIRKAAKAARNALYKLPKHQRKNFTKLMGRLRGRLKKAGDPNPLRDGSFMLKVIDIEECENVIMAYAAVAAQRSGHVAMIGGLAEDGFYVLAIPEKEYEQHAQYHPIGPPQQDPGDQDQAKPSWGVRTSMGGPEGSMANRGQDQEGPDR